MAKPKSRESADRALAMRALAASRVFRDLPLAARTALARTARLEQFSTPTLMNAAGERVGALRYVLRGQIDLVTRNAAGEEVTLGNMSAGSWATWLGVFDEAPLGHDFVSSHDTRCIAFPIAAVREAARAYPELYPHIIGEIGVRFRSALEWLEQSTILDKERRIAKLLQLLARTSRGADGETAVRLPQERLARLARCSRQSVNAVLAVLARRRLIAVRYRRIDILDSHALGRFAGT